MQRSQPYAAKRKQFELNIMCCITKPSMLVSYIEADKPKPKGPNKHV